MARPFAALASGLVLACLSALACPRPATTVPGSADPSSSREQGQETPASSPAPVEATPSLSCGEILPLDLPAGFPVTFRIQGQHPDLEATLDRILAQRSDHEDPAAVGPIRLSVALSAMAMGLRLLTPRLFEVGLERGELAYLVDAQGRALWIGTHGCDVRELTERIEKHWGMSIAMDPGAWIGRAPDGFSFDLLLLPGGRWMLSPAGSGAQVLAALERRRPLDDRNRLGPERPEGADAPVLGWSEGPALLSAGAGDAETALVFQLEASPEGVRVEALSAESPPPGQDAQ